VAISLVGTASYPSDNETQIGPTAVIDKDTGLLSLAQKGDLVQFWCQYRAVADTGTNGQLQPNEYAGQNWNVERGATGSNHHCRLIWAQLDKDWTADPSISHFVSGAVSGALPISVVVSVWRPSNKKKRIVVCNGVLRGTFAAGSDPFTKTITSLTPRKDSSLTMAVWSTADDNTWGSLSGTNWTQAGFNAQYRNASGSQMSMAIAYQIQTSAAATNDVSLNQATEGGDAGLTQIMTFAEIDPMIGVEVETISVVQSNRDFDGSGGTTSIVTLSAVASDRSVIAAWNYETTSGAEVVSILDNQSNEYLQIQKISDMIFEQTALIAWRPGITNAPTTITCTLSATEVFRHAYAMEVAGLGVPDFGIGFASLNPDIFAAWNPFTPARTPSVDGCFLIGHVFADGGADTETAVDDADGWTLAHGGINGTPDEPNALHYQIQGSAASEDYDIDVPTSINMPSIIMDWAAFRPAIAVPVLTSPTGSDVGHENALVGATTDSGNGLLYAVVTTSATTPTVDQIKAGQDHVGAAARWSGSIAVSSTGAKTLWAYGLLGNETYYAHLVQENGNGSDSNTVSSSSFFTDVLITGTLGDFDPSMQLEAWF